MSTLNYAIECGNVETTAECPACGADDATDVAQVRDMAGVVFLTTAVCRLCGLIYRRRRPRLDWFIAMWARRDATQAGTGGPPFNPEVEQTRYRRYAQTAGILRQYGFGSRVLDVGSGPATGLRAFAEAGFAATGLEPDASRARFAEVAGVEIVEATIEEFACRTARRFDGATCQHSLEHFHEPRRVLERIACLLEPGGRVYIEVPDARQSIRDFNDGLYLAHLSNFGWENLVLAGARSGLKFVGREFPPSDEPGETHLAIIFRKADVATVVTDLPFPEARPKVDPVQPADSGHVEWARGVYRRGLPAEPRGDVVRLVVPEINDISLTFKGDPRRVDRTVRANFAGRSVSYDPQADEFTVGE
jgi:SAM-dependent methyltransferase